MLTRLFVVSTIAFLVAGLIPDASAQSFGRNKVRYDDFDFQVLETEHFDIYYYPAMEEPARDVARMAERWYERLSTIFRHEYDERKSIILYADDADFRQTNIANIAQGVQGVTEGVRQRVVLPIAATYAETDHVLGHELVHQFQYDIAQRRGAFNEFVRLPLFLIEGMAEYFSVGRKDALTAMWMRDALLRDDFPSIRDLENNSRYNEYQFGQPFWAYIGGTYGDEAAARLFKTALEMRLDTALVVVTGMTPDSLSTDWEAALREQLVPPAEGRSAPRPTGEAAEALSPEETYPDSLPSLSASRLLASERQTGRINIAPQLSPDGRYVAYLSERDLFGIDLYLADATSGRVISKLESVGSDPHFDALRFIESAGTWSPDGSRFAYVVFANGDNEIAILDVDRRNVVRRIAVREVGAIKDPAWSPDGQTIVFSGIRGGVTDLYMVDVNTDEVTQLTNDRYADLQAAWHPDGNTLTFVTDRGPGTDFDQLVYSPTRLATFDLETDSVEVMSLFTDAKHINPAWNPDGSSLYFISDHGGFNDVYRLDAETGDLYRVTHLATGVAGIADLSPALSIATQNGMLAYSVFEGQQYTVYRMASDQAQGTPVEPSNYANADVLPPQEATTRSPIESYLADARTGLPETRAFQSRPYRSRLSLDYISQPTIGAGYDPYSGSGLGVAGGVSFRFSDQLSNQVLGVTVAANGSFKDIGGTATYLNLKDRFIYGATAGHVPYLQLFTGRAPDGPYPTYYYYRTFVTQVGGVGAYPLNTNQRIEFNLSGTRFGYDVEYLQAVDIDGDGRLDAYRGRKGLSSDDVEALCDQGLCFPTEPLYLGEGGAAFVGDFSYFGFTSPIRGRRYRAGVSGRVGSLNYATVMADYREYLFSRIPGFPERFPITLAARAIHYGRYGPDASSGRLFPLTLTYGPLIRGYHTDSFANTFEGRAAFTEMLPRLYGSRMAVANVELRLPLLGNGRLGLINFPYLPTELVLFGDAGMVWGNYQEGLCITGNQTIEECSVGTSFQNQKPIFSTGVSVRVNVLGALVLEPYYALPLSRDDESGVFGINLTPGW